MVLTSVLMARCRKDDFHMGYSVVTAWSASKGPTGGHVWSMSAGCVAGFAQPLSLWVNAAIIWANGAQVIEPNASFFAILEVPLLERNRMWQAMKRWFFTFQLWLCLCDLGQRAWKEDSAWCSELTTEPPPQHLEHDFGPAAPAGALWGKQPDQAEGHSEGGHVRAHAHTDFQLVNFNCSDFTTVIFLGSLTTVMLSIHNRFSLWMSRHPKSLFLHPLKSNNRRHRPNTQALALRPLPPRLQFPPAVALLRLLQLDRLICWKAQMKIT